LTFVFLKNVVRNKEKQWTCWKILQRWISCVTEFVVDLRDKFSVAFRGFPPSYNIEIYFPIISANFHFHSTILPRGLIFPRYWSDMANLVCSFSVSINLTNLIFSIRFTVTLSCLSKHFYNVNFEFTNTNLLIYNIQCKYLQYKL